MKSIHLFLSIVLMLVTYSSCVGDRKTVIGQEFDTDTFENKDFKGNALNFSELPEDLCGYLDNAQIQQAYKSANVTDVKPDTKRRFLGKNCGFTIFFDGTMEKYSRGFLSVVEDPADVEAEWKEQWEFRKKSLKSAEYIPKLGKAAIWIGKQRKLEVKMDGYSIFLEVPPTYSINDKNAEQHDYKTSAIKILSSSKFF